MFFPITTQASISVIIVSAMVIIVGVLVVAVVAGFVLFVKYERPSGSKDYYFDEDEFPRGAMVCIVMHACELSSFCSFILLFPYSFLL